MAATKCQFRFEIFQVFCFEGLPLRFTCRLAREPHRQRNAGRFSPSWETPAPDPVAEKEALDTPGAL